MGNSALERLAAAQKIQSPGGGSIKPNFGRYRFKVLAHRVKEGGYHGDTGIAEMRVVRSENLPSFPEGCEPVKANAVGENVSYTENLSKPGKAGESARMRYQTHLARTFGMDKPLNIGQLGVCISEKQPGAFVLVDCEIRPKWFVPDEKNKPDEGMWLKNYNWSAVNPSDEELAQIHAERKAAGLPPLEDALQALASV